MTLDTKLLLYILFLVAVPGVLAAGWWLQKRVFHGRGDQSTFARVTKNTLSPMATQMLNKIIDLGYAILVLRILGPEGNGRYAFAVSVWWYFAVISDFGLGTLLTREVARDKSQASRYFTNTMIVRLALTAGSFLPLSGIIAGFSWMTHLDLETILTILLLTLGLLPSQPAGCLSALFYAYEKIEYPAAITTVSTLAKVALGIPILLLGGGIIGLAAVSVAVNLITVTILYYLVRTRLERPRWEPDLALCRKMLVTAFPLMVNGLLGSLFFRVDMVMLKPLQGDTVVGWYSAAYKFVDGLLMIPSAFTLALFPIMSSYAASSKDALMRAYGGALRVLLMIALPISAGTYFIAYPLLKFFAGDAYLPDSAIALQVLIWFLPFSFINGVTQYVLIAINRQHLITLSFGLALGFNVTANYLLIPRYSYVGASAITIATELVLLAPFYVYIRKYVGPPPILSSFLRPAAAAGLMFACLWWIQWLNPLVLVALGGAVYVAGLLALGGLSRDELRQVRRLRPREAGQ